MMMCCLTKLKDKLCFKSMNSYNVQSESSEVKVKEFAIWLMSLFLLTTTCLTPVFVNSTFATRPNVNLGNESDEETLKTSLNVTVYKDFEHDVGEINWLKVIFFVGFGISHFTIGFVGDLYGKWKVLNCVIKILIVSEIVLTITSKLSLPPKIHCQELVSKFGIFPVNMQCQILNFLFREYL